MRLSVTNISFDLALICFIASSQRTSVIDRAPNNSESIGAIDIIELKEECAPLQSSSSGQRVCQPQQDDTPYCVVPSSLLSSVHCSMQTLRSGDASLALVEGQS